MPQKNNVAQLKTGKAKKEQKFYKVELLINSEQLKTILGIGIPTGYFLYHEVETT